jgi:hypothetical protein
VRSIRAGSTRTILASAVPTRSAGSAALGWPSSTAITRPAASAAVNVSGGSRSPGPIWYPPYGPLTDSIGRSASRRIAT